MDTGRGRGTVAIDGPARPARNPLGIPLTAATVPVTTPSKAPTAAHPSRLEHLP